jgi:hypothetical protein
LGFGLCGVVKCGPDRMQRYDVGVFDDRFMNIQSKLFPALNRSRSEVLVSYSDCFGRFLVHSILLYFVSANLQAQSFKVVARFSA